MRLHPFGAGTRAAMALAVVTLGLPLGLATLLGAGPLVLALVTVAGLVAYATGVWRWRRTLHLDALRALRRGRNRAGADPAAQS